MVRPQVIDRIFKIVSCILIIGCSNELLSQDLGQIGQPLTVKFSGSVQLTSNFYSVRGIPNRTSPFAYAISGSPVLQIGDMRFPFQFSFRDQQFGYGTPFNKFGVSPYYKWAKLHLGWRSMNFSPYSLQGKSFFGAGVELTPGKFRFSAFMGKLRNPFAQLDTLVFGAHLVESYVRKTHGFKVGFGTEQNFIDVFYVKVKDDISSLQSSPEIADYELDPADNVVIGTSWKVTALKRIEWATNLNISAFVDNQDLGAKSFESGIQKFVSDLVTINSSTQVSLAGDMSLTFKTQDFRAGLTYRRVEPQYRALGISYIQSDIQSYIGFTSISFWKRKVLLSLKGGIEETNLRNLDLLGRSRFIQDVQVQIIPSRKWQVLGQWANYQYETQDGLIEIEDTLRVVNTTRQSGLVLNHLGDSKTWQTGFSISAYLQNIRNQVSEEDLSTDIQSFQGQLSIKINHVPSHLRISPSVFYSQFMLPGRLQRRYGAGLSLSKGFFDNALKAGTQLRYALNSIDKENNGHTINLRLFTTWQVAKRHSIQLSISLLDKASVLSQSYSETRSTLGYGYRF